MCASHGSIFSLFMRLTMVLMSQYTTSPDHLLSFSRTVHHPLSSNQVKRMEVKKRMGAGFYMGPARFLDRVSVLPIVVGLRQHESASAGSCNWYSHHESLLLVGFTII